MAFTLGELLYKIGIVDKGFKESLDKNEKSMSDFGKSAMETGKKLSIGVSLPLVGLGVAALKVASDFEVAQRKFNSAFKGVTEEGAKNVRTLNTEFGLSSSQATKLLANTGDILKGFGATAKQALDTSLSVQKLSASLSAYSGVPVEQASEAITKALLGETDGLKSLGVALNQTKVDAELVRTGQDKLSGSALVLARSQATLALVYQQSADAVGAFNENQDTAAFQTQVLLGSINDLGVEFGNIMLPALKAIVGGLTGLVEGFNSLGPVTKTAILVVAGLAAAIGPAVFAVGALNTAFAFLLANPIVAGIVAVSLAVAGIAIAIASAVDAQNKLVRSNKEVLETYKSVDATLNSILESEKGLSKERKLSITEIEELQKAYPQLANSVDLYQASVIEVTQAVKDLARQELEANLARTESQIATLRVQAELEGRQKKQQIDSLNAIKEAQANASDAVKNNAESTARYNKVVGEIITTINGYGKKQAELNKLEAEAVQIRKELSGEAQKERDIQAKQAKEAEAIAQKETKRLKEQEDARLKSLAMIEQRKEIEKKLNTELSVNQTKYSAGLITLTQLEQSRLKATEDAIDQLIRLGYTATTGGALGQALFNKLNTGAVELKDNLTKLSIADFGNELSKLGVPAQKVSEILSKLTDSKAQGTQLEDLIKGYSTELDTAKQKSEDFASTWDKTAQANADATKTSTELIVDAETLAFATLEDLRSKGLISQEDYETRKTQITQNYALQRAEIERQTVEATVALLTTTLGQLGEISSNIQDVYLNNLQSSTNEELTQLDERTQAQINALDEKAMGQEAYADAVAKIQADAAKEEKALMKAQALEEYKIKKENFETQKALDIASATISSATAAVSAYESFASIPYVGIALGIIAAAAIVALGATQIAKISSTPAPAPPRLAQGGIVNPSVSGTPVVIGEANSPEAVIPLNDEFFGKLASAAQGSTQGDIDRGAVGGNGTIVIPIYLDGNVITEVVVDKVNNKQYLINANSVI